MKLFQLSLLSISLMLLSDFSFALGNDFSERPVNNCRPSGGGYGYDYAYQQCLAEYTRKLNEYNMYHSQNTGAQAPQPPTYAECNRTDANGVTTVDQACRQQADMNYQRNLQAYNEIKRQEEIARQQQAMQQQQYDAARQAAEDARKKQEEAQKRYQRSQMLSTVSAIVAGAACGAQVYSACPVAVFMGVMAGRAGKQANTHDIGEFQACNASNSYGTSQKDCGPAPTTFDPTGFPNNTQPPLSEIITPDGQCKATPDVCADVAAVVNQSGSNLKDFGKNISAFAGGTKKLPVKFDKNGNAITSDGKTYDSNSFNSEEDLIKAGMSPDQAKKLLANMNKLNSEIAADSKKKNPGEVPGDLDGDGIPDGAGAKTNGIAGGAGNGNADGNALDMAGAKRKLAAAEGLVKEFNGEMIGVAGDDIFKMMNRRYRLKENQDAFMGGQ